MIDSKAWRLGLGILISLAGCRGRGPDVAIVAKGASPFDSLAGVRLGMHSREVRMARPGIVSDPVYGGHGEIVGDYQIGYGFTSPSWTFGFARPSLSSVSATLRPGAGFHADSTWDQLLADASRRFGKAPDCFTDPRSIPQNRLALWGVGDFRYYARFVAPVAARNARLGGAADTVMGRILVGVAPRATLLGGWQLIPDQQPVPADCLAPRGTDPTPRSLRQ